MTASAPRAPGRRGRGLAAFALLSLLMHLAALAWLGRLSPAESPVPARATELVMVEVERRPPPPPPKPEQLKPRPHVRPPPVRVAKADTPPPPHPAAPPPPNEKPPETAKPAPVVVGLTLSSTSAAGSFAAPVGNTLYGKADAHAPAPETTRAPGGPRFLPSYQVDTLPEPEGEIRADYPPEVRREEIEGVVLLSVLVQPDGQVGTVKVLKSLDPRLDALAVQTLRRSRWKPAFSKGERVATEIKYNFRFELSR